jgi:hypothetical protein
MSIFWNKLDKISLVVTKVGEIRTTEVEFKLIKVGELNIKEALKIFVGIFFSEKIILMWEYKRHYKKSRLFRRSTWPKCPHCTKGMSILTKGLGHEKHMLHLTSTFD